MKNKKKTVKFSHLLDLLLLLWSIVSYNCCAEKNQIGGGGGWKLGKYRINFCLTTMKGKLELPGADDNYKANGERKYVLLFSPL